MTPAGLVVEALVESWTNHNILVSVPQNRLVATYGLQPRVIDSDQSVRWDDPEHITYDVVEVRAFSKYGLPNEYTRSEVLLRRAYAEDYAGLRSRAIVAVYYEEHSIAEDRSWRPSSAPRSTDGSTFRASVSRSSETPSIPSIRCSSRPGDAGSGGPRSRRR